MDFVPVCGQRVVERFLTPGDGRGATESRSPQTEKDTIVKFPFTSKFRLRKKREFERIYNEGQKLYTGNLIVFVGSPETDVSRLGVTVSKKVHKRATKRNVLRRRLKEIFRLNRNRLKSPKDLVIVGRKSALECTYSELEEEILKALSKKGLLDDCQ